MKCPKCGGHTAVRASVDGVDGAEAHGHAYMVKAARAVYGWWSDSDFRVRARVCTDCGVSLRTIEVPVPDLADAFDDLRAGATFSDVVAASKK